MDAVKFLQERARMCNSFSTDCEGCLVYEEKQGISECYRWMFENPEIDVKIVEEWSAAHPRKTRQDVFLEQWPNVAVSEDGVIKIRPCNLDVNAKKECLGVTCDYCRREFWMQEVE